MAKNDLFPQIGMPQAGGDFAPLPGARGQTVFPQLPGGPSPSSFLSQINYDGLTKFGEGMQSLEKVGVRYGVEQSAKEGAQAVTRDPQTGELQVDLRGDILPWDRAYNDAAQKSYQVQSASDVGDQMFTLAQQNADDPQAFRNSASTWLKSYVAKVPAPFRADLSLQGQQLLGQYTEGIFKAKATADIANSKKLLIGQLDDQKNQIAALARDGGVQTPAFHTAFAKAKQTTANLRGNPAFGYGEADEKNDLDGLQSTAHAESAVGIAIRTAKSLGEQVGLDQLEKDIWDPSLNLTPAERSSYAAQGRAQIREDAADGRQAREEMRIQVAGVLDDAQASAATTGQWQKVVNPKDILTAYGPIQGPRLIGHLNAAVDQYGITQSVKNATPAQLQDMLTRANPANGGGLGIPDFDTQTAPGMVKPGNLDPWHRPVLHNPDGSYSTTSSMSIGTDDGEVLIPTVVNGKRLSKDEAVAHFRQTGENLGTFKTLEQADTFATALHNAQASMFDAHGNPKTAAPIITGSAVEATISKAIPGATITSRARTPGQNAAADGVPNSAHLTDHARDFVPPKGVSLEDAAAQLRAADPSLKVLVEGPGAAHSTGPHIHVEWDGASPAMQGYADKVRNYDFLQKAIDQRNQALASDPAAYVVSTQPKLAQALQDSDPATFQSGVRSTLLAQRSLGVQAPRILSKAAAGAIVGTFSSPPDPAKLADHMNGVIDNLSQQFGRYFPQVMNELRAQGMPVAAAALAQVRGDGVVAKRLAVAINADSQVKALSKGSDRGLRSTIDSTAAQEVDQALPGELAGFNSTLIGNTSAAQISAQQVYAAQLYAYQLIGEGKPAQEAAHTAADDLLNKHFRFADTYRVPTGVDFEAVNLGARTLQTGIKPDGLFPEDSADPKLLSLGPTQRQDLSAKILRKNGVWATTPDNTGLRLLWPGDSGYIPARDAKGRWVQFSWDQLISASKMSGAIAQAGYEAVPGL